MTWAANHDASLERLRQVQGSLTVDLIMVARDNFETCTTDETAARVKSRNAASFSYFPVIDASGRVVGLYHAERWFEADAPDTPIGGDYAPLSEDIVIGADATILDFMIQADTHPTNLVVSGNRIAGLVSLSDLQRLPVRASLFALITSLEMALSLAIETRWKRPDDWMAKLPPKRHSLLERRIKDAKRRDSFVSEIALTQLHDKADVVLKGGLLHESGAKLETIPERIRDLRNALAHSDEYAATPDAARAVCETVRNIYAIKADLVQGIEAAETSA